MFSVHFTKLRSRRYLKQKIAAYLKARKSGLADSDAHLDYLAASVTVRTLDLVTADAGKVLAGMTREQAKVVRGKMATMLRHVNRQYPLVKAERVLHDEFTFLLEEFGRHAKGTPILIRETNRATMVLFFDHLGFAGGAIRFREIADPVDRKLRYAPPAFRSLKLGPEDLLVPFFKGLFTELGKQTGCKIFQSIFPDTASQLESLLGALKDDIRRIFREELDAKTVNDLNAQISGVVTFMQQTYAPARDGGRDRAYLEQLLLGQHADMTTRLMALLTDKRYRALGIAYLVTGASAHLGIIQELTSMDPSCTDPRRSHYMKTLKGTLHNYVDALTNARSEVYEQRMGYLGPLRESTLHGAATDHWWFVDGWAKYHSPDFYNSSDCCDFKDDAREKADAARSAYLQSPFLPTIIGDLKPYQDTVDGWAAMEKTLA